MKDVIIVFLTHILGIIVFIFFAYRVFSQAKEVIKRDAKIDNEEVPEGIDARQI